jgi:hypothetical protein
MKKVLAVVFATALICVASYGAQAQTPYAQVYFDNTYQQTGAPCGVGVQQLFLVYHNLSAFVSSTQFKVLLPAELVYAGENITAGVTIGNASVGAKYGWPIPLNGYAGPLLITEIFANWQVSCDCNTGPKNILVTDYSIAVGDELKVGTYPDANVEIALIGMTSVVCPGIVPTRTQTWGAIKSLYSE